MILLREHRPATGLGPLTRRPANYDSPARFAAAETRRSSAASGGHAGSIVGDVDRQRARLLCGGFCSNRFTQYFYRRLRLLDRIDDHCIGADFGGTVADLRLKLVVGGPDRVARR